MSSIKKADIRTYTFSKEDRLLLDANVWLSVFGPITRRNSRTDAYSKALKEILTNKCEIRLDVLVVSEFINAFARWAYNQLSAGTKPPEFKIFRNSTAFVPVAEEIVIGVRQISKITKRCDSGFALIDIDAILTEYKGGGCDFNDQMLCELCSRDGLTLVTDDGDFKGRNVPILTANGKLLN